MTNLVVISAGLSEESSTRMLADRLGAATRGRLESAGAEIKLDVIELPTAVFTAAEDWGGTNDGGLDDRIGRAGSELADLLIGSGARRTTEDPFDPESADFADFESLLGR